jgi:hypothetical protein
VSQLRFEPKITGIRIWSIPATSIRSVKRIIQLASSVQTMNIFVRDSISVMYRYLCAANAFRWEISQ